ncbi:unnamed protein product [Hermetia illucens]|uniref:Uncharacterized protein n=1 Tax=Hermetia illucens TaxID=343691 RepID=A0A7R8UUE0_HERIL|nr:unnamed protein product [Hermetia illucens]
MSSVNQISWKRAALNCDSNYFSADHRNTASNLSADCNLCKEILSRTRGKHIHARLRLICYYGLRCLNDLRVGTYSPPEFFGSAYFFDRISFRDLRTETYVVRLTEYLLRQNVHNSSGERLLSPGIAATGMCSN